jgi:hypothetical protein
MDSFSFGRDPATSEDLVDGELCTDLKGGLDKRLERAGMSREGVEEKEGGPQEWPRDEHWMPKR